MPPTSNGVIAAALDELGDLYELDGALAIGELVVGELRERDRQISSGPPATIELAGSIRRRSESVKDLDVVIAAADPGTLLDCLGELGAIESAQRTSATAARGVTHTGMVVEVRAVSPDQFGNLLQHMTGSKQHNAALRERAVRKGLHLSEYGVLDDATGETHRCPTETEVYGLLGLAYIEPELRENRGELDWAAAEDFPRLIEQSDIRDLDRPAGRPRPTDVLSTLPWDELAGRIKRTRSARPPGRAAGDASTVSGESDY